MRSQAYGSAAYFYDTHWRLTGDATLADRGSDIIPQGAGFIVRRIDGTSVFWTNAFPVGAVSAVSRKTHSGTPFDVNLPLSGTPGIECRGTANTHQIVFTFPAAVTFTVASVTSGVASVGSASGSGTSVATVNATGATNSQYLTVTLTSVGDGTNTNDVAVRVRLLTGDTNADGSVNSSDIGQTKSKSGQIVDLTNFRTNLNVDGSLNSSDIGLVKSKSGTGPAIGLASGCLPWQVCGLWAGRSPFRPVQPPAATRRISTRSFSCNMRVDHSRRRNAVPLCSTSVVSGDN